MSSSSLCAAAAAPNDTTTTTTVAVDGHGGVDSDVVAVSPSVSGGDMAQNNSNNELSQSQDEGGGSGGGELPTNLPPSLSAVHTFLVEHALAEHWPVILAEGYEALDDLVELVQPNNKDLFEKLIPKSGHRLRMTRLLTPRVATATDLFASASAAHHKRGMHYAASSRSTLLGTDEGGDENGSVAGSIVSYTSRATTMVQQPPLYGQPQNRTLPKVMSYTNQDGGDGGVAGSSFAGVSQGTTTATSMTPSPSPQRTESSSSAAFLGGGAAAPVKQFLENPAPSGAGRAGGRSPSAASPAGTVRAASRSPHRMSRGAGAAADGSGGVGCSDSRTSFIGNGSFADPGSPQPNRASSAAPNQHVKMKVVVVGQQSCGKSSLIQRLVRNEFQQHMRATLGVDFKEKRFMVGSTVVALHFWDIWGQEIATNATRSYYTGAKGAMIVYDACSEESLQKAVMWKKDLDSKARSQCNGLPIPVVLVGNKIDLAQPSKSPVAGGSSATLLTAAGRPAAGGAGTNNGSGSGMLVSFNNHPDANNNNNSIPPGGNTSLTRGMGTHPSSSSGSVDRLVEGNDATVLKSKEEVQDFCNEHRFSGHFFTSAKTGENVRAVAEYLVLAVLKMEPLEGCPEEAGRNRNARVITLDSNGQRDSAGSPRNARGGKKKTRCTVL